MNKFATMIALVAMFVLAAVSVSALQLGAATIGGENQDRIKNVSTTFTVTNNETSAISVSFASSADSKYNVRFEPATVTLTAGQIQSVKAIADIPLDFNAVDTVKSSADYLNPVAFKIGDIQAKVSTTVIATSDLKMQAVNQLEIKKARIDCDGKTKTLDDGDKMEDLKPDTTCSLEIEAENNFAADDDEDDAGNELKTGDIEFNTVTARAVIDDSSFDLDEDMDMDGLSADDTDAVTMDFDIAEDVDDGTYTMSITLIGKDDNGAYHGEIREVRMDVVKLSHDIQIRGPSLSPTSVSACDGGTIRIISRIANFGKRDENDVAVELSVPDLKFTKRIDQMELDADDSTSVNFVVDVPAKAKPGIYRATISTFFGGTAPSNSQALEFTVDKCDVAEVVVVTPVQQNATVTPQTGAQPSTPAGSAVAVPRARVVSSGSFTEGAGYLWLLGGVGVVLLIIIVILLFVAFRRPRTDVL
jgi:hypothetical protein